MFGPRAHLTVWPDLTPDVDAVLAALPEDESVDFVRETPNGTIHHVTVDETHQPLVCNWRSTAWWTAYASP
ncbi:hypothetical protein ACLQ18_41475 [Streptomyces sp. DT193]|uniref:hypothetical protein n=1 Tax=Streptomyces sp. DT193 TaxID=3393418 RepID=UPI003CFB5B57